MAKRWIAMNLLLLGIAGLLGWELRSSILRFDTDNDPAKIRPARAGKPATPPQKPSDSKPPEKGHLPDDFSIIPEKTIFSDVRGNEEPVEMVKPPEPPQLNPKPILVGTIIIGNQAKAFVIDPTATSSDRRKPEVKRIGDVYRGFTVTAISADQIVLENGARREIIPLHEGIKKGQAGKTLVAPTRVVAFGGSSLSGGGITMSSARSVSATRSPASAPVIAPSTGPQYQSIPGGGQARPPSQPQNQGNSAQPIAQPMPEQVPGNRPGGSITRSPFGDIIRPNRN
jgi:hypothetical protein